MKRKILSSKKSLFLLWLILSGITLQISAQVTLYSENFGTTTAFPTGWTSSNTTNGWREVTTTPSTTYTGASGGSNVNFANQGPNAVTHTLTYANNLSTTGAFTQVTVIWGARATTGFNQTVTFEWRNGNTGTWTNAPYTNVTSNGNWSLINANVRLNLVGALGATDLQFRFTVTSNNSGTTYSIDDFSVVGSSAVNNDCRQVFNTNRLVCGTTTFSDNSNGTGALNEFNAATFPNNNRGCLSTGERQSAWYAFRVRTAGTLTFNIVPSLITNDYDWAIWGPFNSMDANFNCQNLGAPVRCNFAPPNSPAPITGLTGMNLTATGTTTGNAGSAFNRFLDVLPGQIYILMVDNYSTSTTPFTFVWNTATVTASNGNTVSGGGGSATLAAASPGFRTPVSVACNKATFINQSATCDGTLSYLWDFGDGQPVTAVNAQKDPVYYFQAAGTYNVKLTITINSPGSLNDGLTEEFIRQVVIAASPPTATINNLNNNYCIDSPPVTLTGTGSPTGGISDFTIQPNGSSASQINNATQFNPATLGVGTHSVIMQYTSPLDANCVGQSIRQVIVSPKVTPTITGLASTYCPNSPNVNLVGSPTGGTFTVNGTAATQFNSTALGLGTHTVIYTVTNPITTCVSSVTQTVTINNTAPPAITGLNTSYCLGGNPITLVGSPTGGTFTINGTNATEFNPTTLGIGNHTVVYTAAGCVATATQVVEVKANPTLTFTGLNTQYCSTAAAFTLQATPVGGTFKVNTVTATQFSPIALGVGTHTVLYEYTDPTNSSCKNTLSQSVNVSALPTLAITNLNANYCISVSAVTLAATPAGGTFTVNGTAATQFIPSTLGVGTHTVVYSFTDVNGCSNTRTQTSQVFALPILTNNIGTTYCLSNPAITMTGTPGGTFTINGTAATQFNPATLGVGTHTVVQSFTDANSCNNTLSKSVVVNPKPTINFVSLNAFYCVGSSSFALQANPTGGIFRINGVTTTQFNPATLGVGIHTVRYDYVSPTDAGCFNDISQTVEVKASPIISITNLNANYCVTASAITLIGAPTGGTFTVNGTSATQFNPTTLGVGNHTVVYSFTDANGCSNTTTQTSQVLALPILTNNLVDAYCLTSAVVTMTGTPGGTFTINGTAATQFNPATLGVGVYTVVQSFTDANGCSNTLTKTINVNVKPILNFVALNPIYCINAPSFALNATPTGGTFRINGTIATQFNPATLGVGVHTVRYDYVSPTDAGCFNDISQTVEVKPIPVVNITSLNAAYCISVPSFALTATPAGGNFTINGTAATQFNPATLGAGTHTVVYSFTDGNGCTNTSTSSVVVNPLPVLAFVGLNTSYCDSNAAFNLNATPTGGNFTINGTASTQFNPITLGVGNYTVVYNFTDANGCSNSINRVVNVTPKPVLNFVGLNTFYCVNNPSFALNATPTGGTFRINGTIATQFNPTTLGVGMHTVRYDYILPTDAGCFNTISQTVEVKPIPTINITSLNAAYCISVPSFALTATPAGGNFTINGTAATQFNPATLGTGTHTVVYSFTDGNGCNNTSTRSVVVNPLPVLAFVGLNTSYCDSNASFNLNATPAGGAFTINGTTSTQFNPITLGVGSYTVVYNFTDANGCSNSINRVVNVTPKPVLNFVGLNTFYCVNNPSFALNATPTIGGTFRINGTIATQFNPATLGVGIHTVRYDYVSPTDAGCFNTISQTVEVKPIPTINITSLNNAYCISVPSFALTATPVGGTFTINGTAATQFNPATLGAGTHTVVYSFTDGNGCNNTGTRSVVVNPLPVLAFVSLKDTYCTSSATFALTATPAGGTFTVNGIAATQFNPATLGVGNYTVVYNYTDGNGCSNQISKPVAVQLKPTVNIVGLNASYCVSDAVVALSATPVGGTFTINGTNATQFNPATLGTGTYNVRYTYIDPSDAGCFNDVTAIVQVFPLPQIEWQGIIAAYCVSQLTPVNPVVRITYANGTIDNQAQTSFIPAAVGASSQTLSITATDPITGCQRTSTFSYVINALPVLSFVNVPDEYCSQANPLTLQATPTGGQMLIQGVPTTIFNPTLFAVNQNVNIQYTFTAANGCTNTINKTIKIVENPGFQSIVNTLEVCPESATIGYRLEAMTFLEEQALINAGNAPIYVWSNGTSSRFVSIRNESDAGSYTVLIKEQSGCPVKKITFNVTVDCEPKLHLPTAFSPNGDNLNDTWDIYGGDLYKLEIKVYSRWGEVVFIAYGQDEKWDGKRYGLNLPDGTYAWKAQYQNALKPGVWIYKQGSVTIVR